jgi:hypothetical protein
MRSLIVVSIAALLSACASQTPVPEKAAAVPAAAPAAKKAPQCWSGDAGKFLDVGSKTTISGVAVECKLTSDGKAASWVGGKH